MKYSTAYKPVNNWAGLDQVTSDLPKLGRNREQKVALLGAHYKRQSCAPIAGGFCLCYLRVAIHYKGTVAVAMVRIRELDK